VTGAHILTKAAPGLCDHGKRVARATVWSVSTLITNIGELVTNAPDSSGDSGMPGPAAFAVIEDAALVIESGRVAWIGLAARADIVAVTERDPACTSPLDPLLWFKGYHALQTSRVAHWLWLQGRKTLAHFLQSRASALFGVDIHPNARIGKGIFIDHGTGVVIGETAVVEDGVSMLHGVTLGGTGKERGDRHPKVRRGVLLGAGAKVLGNIEIGACAKIAAGSVVLAPVPAGCTAAGVPARIIGCVDVPEPALEMDQTI